jgi:hypothetical protein
MKTITEVLRGCQPGRMQSVGLMQVIPLVSEMEDSRFAPPSELEIGTTNYGTMEFVNTNDKPAIVPCHAAYVVKQMAQDHAMMHAGLIPGKKTRRYDTAACIQQSQGGTISREKHKFSVLPFALREKALQVRREKGYNKLWDTISSFNKRMGADTRAHLEFFLNKFKKQLDEFVAEFESVPRQVGAIILIDGVVAGIERAPSYAFWRSVWPALIRDCYGSLAIESAQDKRERAPRTRSPLPDADEIRDLDDLDAALAKAEEEDEERTRQVVRDFVNDQFDVTSEEKMGELDLETLSHKQFTGQVIRDGERVCYASFVATANWRKNKDWFAAKPFAI